MEVLRDHLSLTGTKTACQETECGTCTVMINGKAVLSCITLAANVQGEEITTIEGLAEGDVLHPVQQAFIEYGSVQCGFCIPGMIMSSVAFLKKIHIRPRKKLNMPWMAIFAAVPGIQKFLKPCIEAGKKMEEKKLIWL